MCIDNANSTKNIRGVLKHKRDRYGLKYVGVQVIKSFLQSMTEDLSGNREFLRSIYFVGSITSGGYCPRWYQYSLHNLIVHRKTGGISVTSSERK